MLKNYLKIAIRNLRKQKLYSLINILGLAVGIAFCALVMLFIHDELSYDQFHEHKKDIYRLYRQPVATTSPIDIELSMPLPTGQAMKNDFPEVEEFVRLTPFGANVIRKNGDLFQQEGFAFADPSFFAFFSFPLKYGEPTSALAGPQSVVITEAIAEKYFGQKNALGKFLNIRLGDEFSDFEVTGVLESIPANSTIQFQVLLPTQTVLDRFEAYSRVEHRWDATRSITYVKLRAGTDVEQVRAKLPQFMIAHMGHIFDQMREDGNLKTEGTPIIYQLQPLRDIHLNPDVPGGFTEPSNPAYSYILGGIALAVLLIACFNFMILSIGRSARRAREVGLRKVVGAQRKQLMAQFWSEAICVTFIAFFIGMVMAEFLLPVFNELSEKELSFLPTLGALPVVAILVSLLLFTGLVAGSYPALVLSNFKPIASLQEKVRLSGSNRFTKSMIVVQFALSVFFIAATLVMFEQLRHVQNKNLGFSGEQVVVIPTSGLDGERLLHLFRGALGQETDIVNMTGANVSFATGLWRRGYRYNGELIQTAVFRVDANYLNTLKMNLVAGRDFDPLLASDSTESIIVNRTFLTRHGLKPDAVGERFPIDWGWMTNPKIIGVVEDFNYQSLHREVEPVMIYMNPRDPILNLMIRIEPDDLRASVAKLRETWGTITNEVPFSYSFLDADMDNLYRAEERWNEIVGYSSFFGIFIACLGLFGLAALTAEQRTKEVGIRKVLGATVSSVATLMSKDFVKLVLLANVLAWPAAWYAMHRWLQDFAYRIEIGWWIFVLAGGLALVIALLTVSTQALRAALANPIESLRYE